MSQIHNFAQAIVFQPYFMEITTLISIWLQLSHNSSSKLLKNFSKSFFTNFKLPSWIFQNKLNSDFQLTCTIPWSTMKPKKIKSLSKAKVRYCFSPQRVKFHFCSVFGLINTTTILLLDLCMKMIWPLVDSTSGNIYVILSLQIIIKKNKLNFKNFAHVGFCAFEMSTKFWDFAAGMIDKWFSSKQ